MERGKATNLLVGCYITYRVIQNQKSFPYAQPSQGPSPPLILPWTTSHYHSVKHVAPLITVHLLISSPNWFIAKVYLLFFLQDFALTNFFFFICTLLQYVFN